MKQEINFRATTGYRSDDSVDAHVEATLSVNYPTVTAQGNTVGWEQIGGSANKFNLSLTNDPRLAGVTGVIASSTTAGIYRFDIPSPGTYRIRCAAGTYDNARGANLRVFDGGTLLSQIVPPQKTTPPNIIDATNTARNVTNWPSLNQAVDLPLTTSILRVYHAGEVVSGVTYTYLAHISVESIPTSGITPAFLRNYYMNQGWA